MGLEDVVRGAAVGLAAAIDPFGAGISLADLNLTGAGPGDKDRAIPTAWAHVVQEAYPRDEPDLGGYFGRLVGAVGGTFGGAAAVGYAVAVTPLAVAVPIGLGAYGAIRGIGRYVRNMVEGEKIGDTYQKGSFADGMRLGWHRGSYFNPWMALVPGLRHVTAAYNPIVYGHMGEAILTGRGYESSVWRSSQLYRTGGAVRRNFASMAGNVIGAFGGLLASPITGIYKTIRDFVSTRNRTQLRPAFIRNA